jgi:anthranilate phosphoribosyltransferase
VETFELDPAGLGLQPARVEDLAGGEPEENAALMRDLLSGRTGGPLADVVALNAGAALSLDDGDLASGIARAHDSLRSGAAAGKLNALVEFTSGFAG